MSVVAKVILYISLVFCFAFPTKTMYLYALPGLGTLNANEIGLGIFVLIWPFSLLDRTPRKIFKTQFINLCFLIFLMIDIVIKSLYTNNFIYFFAYEVRYCLPLIVSIFLFVFKSRIDIKEFFFFIFLLTGISFLTSYLFYLYGYSYESKLANGDVASISTFASGRIVNDNVWISLVYMYYLFYPSGYSKNKNFIIKVIALLSILLAVLSFNRTIIFLLLLEFVFYLFMSRLKWSSKLLIMLSSIAFLYGIVVFVQSDELVYNQVNSRILSIVNGTKDSSSMWKGNRDFMINGALDAFKDNIFFGSPMDVEFFTYVDGGKGYRTDVSLINILARFGITGLTIFILFLNCVYSIIGKQFNNPISTTISKSLFYSFPFVFLLALNVDLFYSKMTIFYFSLFAFLLLQQRQCNIL